MAGKDNKKRKLTFEQVLAFSNEKDYLSDTAFLNLLADFSEKQIKDLSGILDTIAFKSEEENITNSRDLLYDRVPYHPYILTIPYSYFPADITIHEINKLIKKLTNEFFVFYRVFFSPDSVGIRFPVSDNTGFKNLKKIVDSKCSDFDVPNKNKSRVENKNSLKSIHLVTESLIAQGSIFLVVDEHFEMPIRFEAKNYQGSDTAIKKLHDIAYMVNVPGKMVRYDKNDANNINNGIFKKRALVKYMSTNKITKPTLVEKSKDSNILVLKNEILVKDILINAVPTQYQSLYVEKTR
ncbi:MAG TPA: hypothetical protein VF817_05100 [Patescibacteria group bacterium]